MFYQIFLSPQVKQSMIVNNKHGIYKLPQEIPNDFRLSILRNQVKSVKFQHYIEL